MKLSYYISEIRQALPMDWKHIDDRLIIRLLNQFRTIYIKNQYNQNRSIDRALSQTVNLEVKPADESTMDFISTTSRILKSVQAVPKLIKLSHRDLVIAVRNAKILSDNYNYISKEDAVYAGNGKVNTKEIYCFIYHDEDDHLYVKINKANPKISMLTHISLQAIFENPLECMVLQYPETYTEDGLDSSLEERDYEYPMTDTIWGYVKSNILQDGLNIIQTDIADGKEKEV